ncbi:unnamed protein product [Brassicogethes aeneus]|uniref:E3 ubiquitin-protein ligase TRIM33 n=1 Tax=Brassicogethes aeneus TaxID=1431903 RepID=A0A9P0BFK9_BRAAE|nr:unnamed protein product [Brassicogethes aeneus]
MADDLMLNDHSFLPMMEDPNSAEKVLISSADVEQLNQDMLIDAIMSEASELHNPELEQKENIVTDDNHVESPTTGEGFVFKCAFCDQILSFNDEPKLLECLHNACSGCINSKIFDQYEGMSTNELECTQCSSKCDTSKIIDNQFLLETASTDDQNTSKAADLKCSSCSDDANATSYCADCSEFICDSCVQAHQRLKITKDHTIKSKEDGLNEMNSASNGAPANMICATHPQEKLSLFCESCDKLTCRDCQLQEHRDHKYKFTTEIASEARKYISEMLKDVGYKRALLTSAMKVIEERQTQITDKKQELVSEITQLVVKLTNTINVRGKQLVSKLTEVCDSKQKTLQEKKEALEQLSKMTDHCIDFTQHALDKGSDMALLYSKKQMTDHLKRIKCKRADIPNPEIPVRIHLALDKVPDLIKGLTTVMATIGQIVVDGRIYSSQAMSPSQPHNSISPGVGRPPPPSQSPHGGPMHSQNSNNNFQQPRLPGPGGLSPYGGGQFQNGPQFQQGPNMSHNQNIHNMQNMGSNQNLSHMNQGQQNMGQGQQNIGQGPQNMGQGMNLNQNMMGPRFAQLSQHGTPPGLPLSLTQQLTMSALNRIPRPPQHRALIPRLSNQFNHQQQQVNHHTVSSSTHPHGMMQDRSNLRHLLQPNTSNANNPVYVRTGPDQYQAVQPHLAQQFQNRSDVRFPNGQFRSQQGQQNQMRLLLNHNRMPSIQQQQQQQAQQQQQQQQQRPNFQHPQQQQQQPQQQLPGGGQQARGWHTPQQGGSSAGGSGGLKSTAMPTINDNFKITLRQQNPQNLPATVTSTNPKTPSPNHVKGRTDTERNLDKYCEDSVNDLMATIAKLDSNGVQVLPEGRQKGGSPHVDSSTGDTGTTPPVNKIKSEIADTGKDDPNEDWCAVCMDGGELVCCDKCPKVFHQYCHIPNLSVEENDTWQCLLCMNFADIPQEILGERKEGELSVKERKIAERLVLEMYCQYDNSLPFREVIGIEHTDYHAIIKEPIALDTMRQKLNWTSENHYRSMESLVRDVRKMFKNAYTFNAPESLVYNEAKALEKFFDEQLEKFLPEYAYETFDDEDEVGQPPNKKYRRVLTD